MDFMTEREKGQEGFKRAIAEPASAIGCAFPTLDRLRSPIEAGRPIAEIGRAG